MTLLTSIIIFVLGTAVGSFISVIIFRLKNNKKGIIFSSSICPKCKQKLKWRHLVPVLSYIFLRGKCAYCQTKISPSYFFLEIITGITFVLTFLHFNFLSPATPLLSDVFTQTEIIWKTFYIFIFYSVSFSFLITIFFYDLLYKEIPDKISLPAIIIALAGIIILKYIGNTDALIGAAFGFAFFGIQYVISKGRWVGSGDIRLGILMGLLMGFDKTILALALAYIAGAIFSTLLLISKKVTKKTEIPFAPFLTLATITAILFGKEIIDFYLNFSLI